MKKSQKLIAFILLTLMLFVVSVIVIQNGKKATPFTPPIQVINNSDDVPFCDFSEQEQTSLKATPTPSLEINDTPCKLRVTRIPLTTGDSRGSRVNPRIFTSD